MTAVRTCCSSCLTCCSAPELSLAPVWANVKTPMHMTKDAVANTRKGFIGVLLIVDVLRGGRIISPLVHAGCSSHTNKAPVIVRHVAAMGAYLDQRPSVSLYLAGIPHRYVTSGRESTSRGAATVISSSCWVICTEKSHSPSL